jgi:dihydrofolate reductase
MKVSAIVAMSREGIIGDDQGMPWELPADLRRFKKVTLGKPLVMGRKTHESIGRVLPGRPNLVLTRQPSYQRPGIYVATAPQEALEIASLFAQEVMIIGGGEVYRLFAMYVHCLHLTVVEGFFTGTVYFPLDAYQTTRWHLISQEQHPADQHNRFAHRYYVLERAIEGVEGEGVELAELLAE